MTDIVFTVRHDPTAKFQILTQVPAPAYCVACRKDSTGSNQFVDLTMDIDYYGAVLLCVDCTVEIARMVGFTDAEDKEDKTAEVERVNNRLYELEEKCEVLERVIFTYNMASDNSDSDSSDSSDGSDLGPVESSDKESDEKFGNSSGSDITFKDPEPGLFE